MNRAGIGAAALALCVTVAGCTPGIPGGPEEIAGDRRAVQSTQAVQTPQQEEGEEALRQAEELFENTLPDHGDNPFDVEAINEEIYLVMQALQGAYGSMERQEDLLGRIFRPDREQLLEAAGTIQELGYPVVGKAGADIQLRNPQALEEFYERASSFVDAEAGVYEIDSLGALSRVCFLSKAGELYHARVPFSWTMELEPAVEGMGPVSRVDYLVRTEKDYLIYGNDKDGFSSITGGYRLRPLEDELVRMKNRYLSPLGSYAGHNVLTEDWDLDTLSALNFNDVFELLYHAETGNRAWDAFDARYVAAPGNNLAVPGEVFEEVITRYFLISPEELRHAAVYDSNTHTYAWKTFTNGGYGLDWEVVEAQRHDDGSITLVVDALYLHKGQDRVATNYLKVLPGEEDGFRYLSNRIERNGEAGQLLPPHRHRVR